jgi:surface antigen
MRLLLLLCVLLAGCTNTQYFALTGHNQQADVIQASFQQALEHNPDGSSTHWYDKATGKRGYVMPIYEAPSRNKHCRFFEIGYYYTDLPAEFYHGKACRRDQVWHIY